MKRIFVFLLFLSLWACTDKKNEEAKSNDLSLGKIQVGVFDGHGGAEVCKWEAKEAIKLDKDMEVRMITSADIAGGVLDELDAIIIPGGGGSRQYLNLGHENQERIKEFIKSGHGALGICAGAYLFSDTPEYSCMGINGACAIDIEHDNRGHGLAKFSLTDEGKKLFPELADRDLSYVVYYEGPVIDTTSNPAFTTFAMMESDVHTEGNAPANMTNNRPFFIASDYGEGRVFSSIAHPEATPGMRWIIPRIIRWTLKKDYVDYSENAVRPDMFNQEILFTKDMLKKESNYYDTFLYGTSEEKVAALDWLHDHVSWSAKRWVQGLVYDKDPAVRARAAYYISESEFTHYLPDLENAYANEKNEEVKVKMKEALDFMKGL
ncbi:glutamine amidotransferase PdxT [Balneicella halophila]|uniref:Glutamine amidotransferase PdxT n=2 Tax=Balneicella halophila TaxID=1537566 RepID=A0A7L4UQ30_BALHA|nr:BPL-N domain-containing protein [Balneicella halophila]PVX51888.1 glutamine amidotransferase PdxT [Balneicella halophila]